MHSNTTPTFDPRIARQAFGPGYQAPVIFDRHLCHVTTTPVRSLQLTRMVKLIVRLLPRNHASLHRLGAGTPATSKIGQHTDVVELAA